MLQRLPVGIQTLPEIINGNYLYVDKTQAIHRLITSGKYFFLARPRRFGKSLTLSTIKEIYQGNRALFQGLWVEQHWDWGKTNPVIHISFSSIGYKHIGLKDAIQRELLRVAQVCLRRKPTSNLIGRRYWRNYANITMAIRGMASRGFITRSRS